MISIPLPFVVALGMALFLFRIVFDESSWGISKVLFASLVVGATAQVLLNTFVWNYGATVLRPLQPLMASVLPIIAWMSFLSLSEDVRKRKPFEFVLRLLPTGLIAILLFVWPPPIDVILIAQYMAYGIILLKLAEAGPDILERTRLHQSLSASRAIRLAAIMLIGNALIDGIVMLDFRMSGGENISLILSGASLFILLTLGATALTGQEARLSDVDNDPTSAQDPESPENSVNDLTDEEINDVLERVRTAMTEQRLFINPELTLVKIARKIGIPSRHISNAINRGCGVNVSQFVNNFRITEACRLLETTDESITNIHLDSGFMTKSNFNREFRRSVGCSPSEWRARQHEQLASDGSRVSE